MSLAAAKLTLRSRRFWIWQLAGAGVYAIPVIIRLATGNVAKKILNLAGVKDCWAFTRGKTKTTVNYAKAVFNALEQNAEMRIILAEAKKVGIVSGSIEEEKTEEKTIPEPVKNDKKPKEETK